jgi:uncharacterized membrane protein YphA (DoxX/SURF4 family)
MKQDQDDLSRTLPDHGIADPAPPHGSGDRSPWYASRVPSFAVRLVLGATFLYACMDKIIDPAAFAQVIHNYQILPDELINLAALVLPWLELLLGLALILGMWLPGAVFLCNLLLVVFLGALTFNMIRGLDIQCGCFTTPSETGSGAPMTWYLLRDGVFLVLGLYLYLHIVHGKGRTPVEAPSEG